MATLNNQERQKASKTKDEIVVVKIEPKTDDEEDFVANAADLIYDQTLNPHNKLELIEELNFSQKEKDVFICNSGGREETMSSCNITAVRIEAKSELEDNFNIESTDTDSGQNLSDNIEEYRVYFKKEKSVDIDDIALEREPKAGADDESVVLQQQSQNANQNVQGKFTCQVCGKNIYSKKSLRCHERLHTGERPFLCCLCPKAYTSHRGLKTHELTHSPGGSFPCSKCKKNFKYHSALKRHVKERHIEEKPHQCTLCSKKFPVMCDLRQHMRRHRGEKPFKCSVCSKGFLKNCLLRVHMQRHTDEKPHGCAYCSKVFKSCDGRDSHQRLHDKPYVCKDCGKTFLSWRESRIHKRIHDREKPFKEPPVCVE